MLQTNVAYMLTVDDLSTLPANKLKSISVSNAIVLYQIGRTYGIPSTLHWENPHLLHDNISKIDISTLDGSVGIFVTTPDGNIKLPLFSNVIGRPNRIWVLFNVVSDDTPFDLTEVESWCEEMPNENHTGLQLDFNGATLEYNETSYTNDAVVPIDNSLDKIDLSLKGRISPLPKLIKYQHLNVVLHGEDDKQSTIKSIQLLSNDETVKLPYVLPLGETGGTVPYISLELTGISRGIAMIDLEEDTPIKINGISSGTVTSTHVTEDTDYLDITVGDDYSNYHFTRESAEKLISLLTRSDFYLYETNIIDYKHIQIKFIGVLVPVLTIPLFTPEDIDMELDPTVTKNLTGITVLEESTAVYGEPYEIKLQATDTANKTIRSVVAQYGTTYINVDIDVNGIATLTIPELIQSLTISASAEDKYTMSFEVLLPPITFKVANLTNRILFKKDGALYRIVVNDEVSTTFNIVLQENEKVVGLSVDGVTVIPFGVEVNYKWDGTSVFNLVKKTIPAPQNFVVNFYNLNGEKNTVDKTDIISFVAEGVGTLRAGSSIMNPVVDFEYNYPDFNYVYIENFHRYYFVTDISNIKNGLWSMSLHVDVLMSFKDEIRANKGVIARNENDFNNLIEDTQRLREKDDEIEIIDINDANTPLAEDLSGFNNIIVQAVRGKGGDF